MTTSNELRISIMSAERKGCSGWWEVGYRENDSPTTWYIRVFYDDNNGDMRGNSFRQAVERKLGLHRGFIQDTPIWTITLATPEQPAE